MKKPRMIAVIVIVTVTISLFLVQWIQAKNPGQQEDIPKNPIWQITQEGTAKSVEWIEYAPNPRFAIYDPGTPEDETDDVVFDMETGLVWERCPDTKAMDWYSARRYCYQSEVANRKGWRLPTVEELASLVDMNGDGTGKMLPAGHPFTNVQSSYYWSSSTYAPSTAWFVGFSYGFVNGVVKSFSYYVWCVRGGHGHDAY